MDKITYWANIRNSADQAAYFELSQISKGRWKVVLNFEEFIIKSTSTDPFEVLEEALKRRKK